MNLERAQALAGISVHAGLPAGIQRFSRGRAAEMVVKVRYRAPATKEFEVISETGSKVLIDRVFRKLLQGEKEAFEAENQKRIAAEAFSFSSLIFGLALMGSKLRPPRAFLNRFVKLL